MPGKIKFMLEEIIRQRAAANPLFASTTRTKLILKGFDPAKFSSTAADDPAIVARVVALGAEMGVTVG